MANASSPRILVACCGRWTSQVEAGRAATSILAALGGGSPNGRQRRAQTGRVRNRYRQRRRDREAATLRTSRRLSGFTRTARLPNTPAEAGTDFPEAAALQSAACRPAKAGSPIGRAVRATPRTCNALKRLGRGRVHERRLPRDRALIPQHPS